MGWLACGHHLGSYFSHLLHLHDSARYHFAYMFVKSFQVAGQTPPSHYCCVNWPRCAEHGCLTCPLPRFPLPWANT